MYLISNKLTIYPFKNYVYKFNYENFMSNDIIRHGIDAAGWSIASLPWELAHSPLNPRWRLRVKNFSCLFKLSFSND